MQFGDFVPSPSEGKNPLNLSSGVPMVQLNILMPKNVFRKPTVDFLENKRVNSFLSVGCLTFVVSETEVNNCFILL